MKVDATIRIRGLLRALRTRELTAAEWDELRSAARQDPFLRDALEGLAQLPSEERQDHLQAIARRFPVSKLRTNTRVIALVAVAATIAMIIIAVHEARLPGSVPSAPLAILTEEASRDSQASGVLTEPPRAVSGEAQPQATSRTTRSVAPEPAGKAQESGDQMLLTADDKPKTALFETQDQVEARTREAEPAPIPNRDSQGLAGRALSSPSVGAAAYAQYLKANLIRPDSANEEQIHGVVVLEFRIDTAGMPYDFQILQSLGEAFDQEAVRLLREGPTWNIGQVNVGRQEIRF